MQKPNRFIIGILLIAVLMAGMHLIVRFISPQPGEPEEHIVYSSNHLAPDFTVYDGDGKEVRLADFYPEPIVLHFWVGRESDGRAVLPVLEELYLEYGQSLQFVMVDVTDGTEETQEAAEEYLKKKGYSFPVYYDLDGSATDAYGTRILPATFFISSEFELIARANGDVEREVLEQGITMALESKDSAAAG